ncbi:TetR/AcrR family transcriptional regulator [Streptomyces koyangensis]|uniref:TetR/AcrR family transcriptional regulator n=1 Tax=Streptomyces koyangensis TaxID=188770 RepID=UPI00365E1D02|nr:TetR/AcrR family transcriptional regulator [Streptomyces albidoflavus]
MTSARPTPRAGSRTRTRTGTKGVARADRERQIVRLAVEEFGTQGYARASVADVAERAGISKPLIYTYFTSKDGLAAASAHYAGSLLVSEVEAAQTATTAEARALDTLAAIFSVLDDCRRAWSVVHDTTLPEGSAAHAAAAKYRERLAEMGAVGTAEILRAAGDDDPLDHELLSAVWQHAVTAIVQWWLDHPEQTAADMAARAARMLHIVLGPHS